MNPGTGSPETHRQAGLNKALVVTVCGRREQRTHKVAVHLPHPTSHVDHHVVEQAERVPQRVLENGEGERMTMTGLACCTSERHSQLVNNPVVHTGLHAQNPGG